MIECAIPRRPAPGWLHPSGHGLRLAGAEWSCHHPGVCRPGHIFPLTKPPPCPNKDGMDRSDHIHGGTFPVPRPGSLPAGGQCAFTYWWRAPGTVSSAVGGRRP